MEQPAQHQQDQARRPRAVRQGEQLPPQRCPRCESTNTKFCYFNNYSSSQPRYFCKTCRRYWTQGGTLRNVPHGGGGGRKGKRSKKASPSTSNSSASATIITTATDSNPPQDLPLELQFEDNMDPFIAAASNTMALGSTSGSVASADAPPSTLYYGGGGMGTGAAGGRTFTPSTMVGDVGGGLQAVVPPYDAQFLYGFHFPQTQQPQPQPQPQPQGFHLLVNERPPQQQQFIPLNPNLMMMPQPVISQHGWHHQQFSAAPFASTISAAMPNAAEAATPTPAAGVGDVTDAYWSHVTSGRWDPDLTDRGPQPPSPPPF